MYKYKNVILNFFHNLSEMPKMYFGRKKRNKKSLQMKENIQAKKQLETIQLSGLADRPCFKFSSIQMFRVMTHTRTDYYIS